MATQAEKIAHYSEANQKLGLGLSEELIAKVTASLGPVIYNQDAEVVSCSDKSEVERVKTNFLEKKLGLSDDTLFDSAIQSVCEKMGTSNTRKYRALFYALLAKEFGKESIYV